MQGQLWRNLAEIMGVFGIMAGLLKFALELRQASESARTQVIMDLAGRGTGHASRAAGRAPD